MVVIPSPLGVAGRMRDAEIFVDRLEDTKHLTESCAPRRRNNKKGSF